VVSWALGLTEPQSGQALNHLRDGLGRKLWPCCASGKDEIYNTWHTANKQPVDKNLEVPNDQKDKHEAINDLGALMTLALVVG
jgi:hypothetical protein